MYSSFRQCDFEGILMKVIINLAELVVTMRKLLDVHLSMASKQDAMS